jgi:hypothetical protein
MAVRFVTGVLQEVATAIAVLLACRRHCSTIRFRYSAFLTLAGETRFQALLRGAFATAKSASSQITGAVVLPTANS